ncbi:anti-sigma factor domain-containing protein [Nesterenkonia rhizosphaerae]|uniref:Regulator of SigK n=1 Tax=Nesterenkonia rhizosphaerae TaxID=1348272 RepID=A0ABP9FSI6_9MICC
MSTDPERETHDPRNPEDPAAAESAEAGDEHRQDELPQRAQPGSPSESPLSYANGSTEEEPREFDDGAAAPADPATDAAADSEAEPAGEPEEPTLAELLTGTARGETASFSAFYESTSDVIYGLALLMHAEPAGAQASTVAVYQHLWDQADARARDLRLQTQASQLLTDEYADFTAEQQGDQEAAAEYRPNEYEQVLEWLVPLAHRIFVERFREGAAEPIQLTAVAQSDGGGVAGLPEEILEDLLALSDSQAQALALTYLSGLSHHQLAQSVGAALPSVKSRLRDAMTRLHTQRTERESEPDPILRAAVTRKDVERGSGVNRNFASTIAADLDKGLLVELAELYALDAVDDAERALLDEKALTADAREAQQWDTRVLAARRTLAEIFAAHPVVPPSHLLDEVLQSVGDQEVGVGLVEGISTHTEETEKRTPVMKKWMFIAGFLLVLLVGIVVIYRVTSGVDVQSLAENDQNAVVVEDSLADGGQMRAVVSEAENVAWLEFSGVPDLAEDATYQVWLLPHTGGQPSSVGNFDADELEDGVDVRGISQYRQLQISVESIRGQERPTGAVVADLPLHSEGSENDGDTDAPAPEEDAAEDEAGS